MTRWGHLLDGNAVCQLSNKNKSIMGCTFFSRRLIMPVGKLSERRIKQSKENNTGYWIIIIKLVYIYLSSNDITAGKFYFHPFERWTIITQNKLQYDWAIVESYFWYCSITRPSLLLNRYLCSNKCKKKEYGNSNYYTSIWQVEWRSILSINGFWRCCKNV